MLFISYNLRLPYERNGSLGIAPTFLKFDSWLPGAGFIPIISIIEINQIKKGNCKQKKSFMHTKRFIIFLKIRVQFCVGAIPRLPKNLQYSFNFSTRNQETNKLTLKSRGISNVEYIQQ